MITGSNINHMLCAEETIYTVFPNDPSEPWQDFETYQEAKKYGDEKFGAGNYKIESPVRHGANE